MGTKVVLSQYTTSIVGRSGFTSSVEVTINQTLKVEPKEAATKLIAEYPTAAEWAEKGSSHGNDGASAATEG